MQTFRKNRYQFLIKKCVIKRDATKMQTYRKNRYQFVVTKCVFKRGATKKKTLKTIPKSVGGRNQNNTFKLMKNINFVIATCELLEQSYKLIEKSNLTDSEVANL